MKAKLFYSFFSALLLVSCSGSDSEDVDDNGSVSNTLHMSFKTPDWEQFINCEQLDLFPSYINESTNYVSATSASTKETFFFSIPTDSSAMVAPGNLKRYAISEFGQNQNSFEFSQKLPITPGSTTYIASVGGLSETSYNEVVSINYAGTDGNSALFRVKCRYKMDAYEVGNETNIKSVSGTFHFKVRTSRE
ncbi:MAG TPA: hypothetical protein VEA37_03940 [Flavobacterium sp.]|nr:hypothetical protein [Flavobacterium sp.]